jgi:hypothetical protein
MQEIANIILNFISTLLKLSTMIMKIDIFPAACYQPPTAIIGAKDQSGKDQLKGSIGPKDQLKGSMGSKNQLKGSMGPKDQCGELNVQGMERDCFPPLSTEHTPQNLIHDEKSEKIDLGNQLDDVRGKTGEVHHQSFVVKFDRSNSKNIYEKFINLKLINRNGESTFLINWEITEDKIKCGKRRTIRKIKQKNIHFPTMVSFDSVRAEINFESTEIIFFCELATQNQQETQNGKIGVYLFDIWDNLNMYYI